MALPYTNLSWIQNGEPVTGTNDPAIGNGPANRPARELLDNDMYLDGQLDIIKQYLSGSLGQATPDYLVLPVGTDKFAPDL